MRVFEKEKNSVVFSAGFLHLQRKTKQAKTCGKKQKQNGLYHCEGYHYFCTKELLPLLTLYSYITKNIYIYKAKIKTTLIFT